MKKSISHSPHFHLVRSLPSFLKNLGIYLLFLFFFWISSYDASALTQYFNYYDSRDKITVVENIAPNITSSDFEFNDELASVTSRSSVYSISNNLLRIGKSGQSQVLNGSGTGVFSEAITGLNAETTYDVRAYAINSEGASYGNEESFRTSALPISNSPNNVLYFDADAKVEGLSGISPSSFTIEFWIYLDGSGNQYQGVYWSDNDDSELGIYVEEDNSVSIWDQNFEDYNSGLDNKLLTNDWTHVAFTYDGSILLIYLNGNHVSSHNASDLQLPTTNVQMGDNNDGTYGSYNLGNSALDELRIWSLVRTQTEIRNNKDIQFSIVPAGLERYYTFNEGTGGTNNAGVTSLQDVTTNGINGTLSGFSLSGTTSNWIARNSLVSSNTAPVVTSPTVTTSAASDITATIARFGGNVTEDGGAAVTARGFVYSSTDNTPTIGEGDVTDVPVGSGTGVFNEAVTGLSSSTTYHYQAYATNSAGTSYGGVQSFDTVTDCTTPPDQTFGDYEDINYLSSATYQCIVYFSSNGEVGIGNSLSQAISDSPLFSGSAVVMYGNTAGGHVGFKSVSTANNFKLVSLVAEFFGHSNGSVSEIYTIKGYDEGVEKVSVDGFAVTTSATYGVNSAAIGYIREDFNTSRNNSGTLTFGSGWSNIDEVRFFPEDATPYNNVYLALDNIDFEPAEIGSSSPIVSTDVASAISSTGATLNGNVTSDGGSSVTARGFVYSSTDNTPTIGETGVTQVADGTGIGSFSEALTGLSSSTTYHYQAYATNSVGTTYGGVESFTTAFEGVLLSTNPTLQFSASNATILGAIITDGQFGSTAISDANIQLFEASLSGNTTNQNLAYYTEPLNGGIVKSAGDGSPMMVIAEQGGEEFDFRGIEVAEYLGGGYTIKIEGKRNGLSTGSITTSVDPNTFIWLLNTSELTRSIFQNVDRVEISDNEGQLLFIYLNKITVGAPVSVVIPSLSTSSASGITATTAIMGGNVTADGGSTVSARGFVYSSADNIPIIGEDGVINITVNKQTGVFSETVTGLSPSTTYYYQAYATNSTGTSYGGVQSFSTLNQECLIQSAVNTIDDVENSYGLISQSFTACQDGSIKHIKVLSAINGSEYPVNSVQMTIRSGDGLVGSIIKIINISTDIFVEATSLTQYSLIDLSSESIHMTQGQQYTFGFEGDVSNAVQLYYSFTKPDLQSIYPGGKFYFGGEQQAEIDLIFEMELGPAIYVSPPSVTIITASDVTSSGATLNAEVTSDGGASVTTRGFVYSRTDATPTIGEPEVIQGTDGDGTGIFSQEITDLTAGTTYYARAYATNSAGTTYGEIQSLKTSLTPRIIIDFEESTRTYSGWNTKTLTIDHIDIASDFYLTSSASPVSKGSVLGWAFNGGEGTYFGDPDFETQVELSVDQGRLFDLSSLFISNQGNSGSDPTDFTFSTNKGRVVISVPLDETGSLTEVNFASLLNPSYFEGVSSVTIQAPGSGVWFEIDDIEVSNLSDAPSTAPSVTTSPFSSVSSTGATLNGNVTSDGGASVTARGFVYSSTDTTPTIGEPGVTQVTDGYGTGIFSQEITEVTIGTTYYARAYATNSVGTTYGDEISFTIPKIQLTITEPNVTTSKVFDGNTTAVIVSLGTVTGVLAGEDVTVAGIAVYEDSEVGVNKRITVSYTLDGAAKAYYLAPESDIITTGEIKEAINDLDGDGIPDEVDPDIDGDGIDNVTEQQVPNATGIGLGDGNGDAIPDYLQAHVVSFKSAELGIRNDEQFVTMATSVGDYKFSEVVSEKKPTGLARSVSSRLPYGVTKFTLDGLQSGEEINLSIFVGKTTALTGYFKQANGQTAWTNLIQGGISTQENKKSLTFTISDNGVYDLDATDGVLKDPGLITAYPMIFSNGGDEIAEFGVKENQLAVTTIQASDLEWNTFTYGIEMGADELLFDVNADTGELKFKAAPDFENPRDSDQDNVYELIVNAFASNGTVDRQQLFITVEDDNDTPSFRIPEGGIVYLRGLVEFEDEASASSTDENPGDDMFGFGFDGEETLDLYSLFEDQDQSGGNTMTGMAISENTADAVMEGVWEYSTDLDALVWYPIGAVSKDNALLLDMEAFIRFVPVPNFFGSPKGLKVHPVDGSGATVAPEFNSAGGTAWTFDNEKKYYTRLNDDVANSSVGVGSIEINIKIEGTEDLPESKALLVNGIAIVEEELTGSYTYVDVDGDLESGTELGWFGSVTGLADSWISIIGASSAEFTLTQSEANHYIRFGVRPNDGKAFGEWSYSEAVGPVISKGKVQLTISAPVLTLSKEYDGSNTALVTAGTLSGVFSGDEVTVTATASYADANAGTVKTITVTYTLSGKDAEKYLAPADDQYTGIIIVKALTITADNKSKVYGQANPTLTFTYSGLVNGDSKAATEPSIATTATASPNVGTYPITLEGAADANYNITLKAGELEVTKATLTITADNNSKVYGQENPSLTLTYTGLVNGDTKVSSEAKISTTATVRSNVGTYPITLSGGSDDNYDIELKAGILTVGKAKVTITADDKNKVYGESNPALTFKYTGLVNEDSKIAIEPIISTSATVLSKAGTYAIELTGGSDDNYEIELKNGTLTVGKVKVIITADNKQKTYGEANPALTFTYSGLVNGNTKVATEPSIKTTTTASSNLGTYPIELTGGSDDNYDIELKSGTLTVGKAKVTITADDKNKVYGESNPALTFTYSGLVNGDTKVVTEPSIKTTTTASSNVGTYPITLTGGSDDNYNIELKSGTLTVGKAKVTITADDKNKVYGESNPALTFSYSGLVNGDTKVATEPSIKTTTTASSNVGTYPITLTGGSDDNYDIELKSGTLMVGKAKVIITADNKQKTYGEANPALTFSYAGLVNGDTELSTEPSIRTTATASSGVGTYPI
ncbi:MBG domain-containing protein, partial [Belliella aquatica]|uniref:MBG domain-containing protein n=1 Tax=Belliella aquatica TaxID=1323734 RepID=UPI001F4A26F6